jgi:hypothetical protein
MLIATIIRVVMRFLRNRQNPASEPAQQRLMP